MAKLLMIVNPSASSVTPRSQVLIQRVFNRAHDVELVETSRRGHATRLAEDAAARQFDGTIVLGGDGTLNEAANGLIDSDTALLPLPGGSTNVFARTLGLPDDPLEAAAVVLGCFEERQMSRVGLGTANGRAFLFHAGLGFDAAVVEQVERNSDLKRYLSHPLFAYKALTTWLRHFDRKHPHFRVDFPDGTSIADGFFLVALNTNPYTYLGSIPFDIAPDADLDKALSVVTVRSLRADHLVQVAVGALLGNPRLTSGRNVDHHGDLSTFTVSADKPFPWQLDGDFLGSVERVEFTHRPHALLLVRP